MTDMHWWRQRASVVFEENGSTGSTVGPDLDTSARSNAQSHKRTVQGLHTGKARCNQDRSQY